MAKAPAYQYYAADFEMDTAGWTVDEVGIYQRLLNYEWINGALPDDLEKLARIVRISSQKMKKKWPTLKHKFFLNGDGKLVNRRMEEERENQDRYRQEQSRKGKRGAKKRWPGDSRGHSRGYSTGNGRSIALQSSSSSSIKDKEKDIQLLQVVLRDKTYFKIPEKKILEYQKVYPNINVRQEILKIIQWNEDNPDRRKTKRGILRHINTWLSKAQGETKNIEAAPKPREHEPDNLTDEQRRANMAKTKKIVGDWVEPRDINRIIEGQDLQSREKDQKEKLERQVKSHKDMIP